MSKMIEYKVGEIFRHDGKTFKCVEDPVGFDCDACMHCMLCIEQFPCSCYSRKDGKSVHFVRIFKPKKGMLFRASNGVLYELRKRDASGCFCNIDRMYSCPDITKEAFGNMISPDLHWYPV